MPGAHTFYDGSKIFDGLSEKVGFETDKLNLVFCQFLSIAFAIIYYVYFPPKKTSNSVRLAYPFIVGISFCYFCYGHAIKHILANLGISYALMCFSPPQYVHKLVFIFSMGYLVFIHWFRWYIFTSYSIDITGPMMVVVQKATTLAFSLHDGRVKKKEELNSIQQHEAIREVPTVLEYLSYMFSFQTVLTGPLCFYRDYQQFITGENLKVKDRGPISPWRVGSYKIAKALVFMFMIYKLADAPDAEMIAEAEYMAMPWYKWFPLFFFVIFMQRVMYYYAWIIADAVCNLSGFGFNGFDEFGNEKWDLVTIVDPWKVETALSFKDTLDGWNITTMHWLRRVAYDRVPKNYRTVSTYLLSAMWHGFFLGYYMTFLTGAIITVGARNVRRSIRPLFQSSFFSKRLYDVITFFATKVALMYTTYPFVTMHFNPGFFVYRRLYFFYHILAIFAIVGLPKLVPPPPRKPDEDSKKLLPLSQQALKTSSRIQKVDSGTQVSEYVDDLATNNGPRLKNE